MQCPDPPVTPDPSQSNAGGWALLIVLPLVVLVIDYVLWKTGRPTMSQWSKKNVRKHPIKLGFALGLITLLMLHIAAGGPLW